MGRGQNGSGSLLLAGLRATNNYVPDPEFVWLAPSVVPGVAGLAVAQRAAAEEQRLQHENEMLALGVEARLAVARAQRMAMQNDDPLPLMARQSFQPSRKVDLLAGEELLAEAADLAERMGVAEDERARRPPCHPARRIPEHEP